ncbi:MAG: M1 family metallopeptidase [Cyclobacteriaceae bacterium]
MKLISFCLFLLAGLQCLAQSTYWQQKVQYQMEIDFDVSTHQFSGKQSITYFNNSPDTLKRVFYHLYFNAFQPGSQMDIRSRTIRDADPRVGSRISSLRSDEIGFQQINYLKQDIKKVEFETVGTILEVTLDHPILPRTKSDLYMEFSGQVPLQIRRSGRDNQEGISYSMAQWYPKLAEYDPDGWHPNPYIGREFYGVWGDFDVKINIDKDYMIAASGHLQNPEKIGHGYSDDKVAPKGSGSKLNWHFIAENVHDFVWAADPDYQHTIAQVPNGPTLHFFYQKGKETKEWENLPQYTVKAFQYMSEHFGVYPYKKYSVIQAGDGGMEYPMATLITGNRNLKSLVGVTVHELIHSWYQMVLGTNESLHSWMDEGFTSYASSEVMAYLFDQIRVGQPSNYGAYFKLVESGVEEPLSTHADHFNFNYSYGLAAYVKGSIFLNQLAYVIGKDNLDRGMRRYYNTWKFKHPDPYDFIRIMEKESGLVLDWYLEYWVYSTKTIDYGIKEVADSANMTHITIERIGDMIMPIDLEVESQEGTKTLYHIPLSVMRGEKPTEEPEVSRQVVADWGWTHPTYTLAIEGQSKNIKSITIDPSMRMADLKGDNNRWGGKAASKSAGQ